MTLGIFVVWLDGCLSWSTYSEWLELNAMGEGGWLVVTQILFICAAYNSLLSVSVGYVLRVVEFRRGGYA